MMSALPALALNVGALRVVRGVRIEHVCGDPSLSPEEDRQLGRAIVATALRALQTTVDGPTLFEPRLAEETRHAS
jgi:glycine/betaine/sarcosine/D-proline reductase family selenoprotein B